MITHDVIVGSYFRDILEQMLIGCCQRLHLYLHYMTKMCKGMYLCEQSRDLQMVTGSSVF